METLVSRKNYLFPQSRRRIQFYSRCHRTQLEQAQYLARFRFFKNRTFSPRFRNLGYNSISGEK